ncbi:MAG: hypothetical protein REI64_05910 [Pedobacter sp.]|uniref:hypothetical protein n=1 Tax=Pedobacter sp. TaxID=1411316 RepID=UPI00280687E1|nr:hypothetical protein [Pedobacter sp.]MDQ8004316.1 hypothetical protein [Pedobacter sp.]
MKISKIFNENKTVANFFYSIFNGYHQIRRSIKGNGKFQLLGDKPVKFYVPLHPIPESNLFGHISVFKKYLGNKSNLLNIHVQHGVILGNLVQKIMKDSFATTIITYSKKRQDIIKLQTGKKVIAVGPYIQYSKSRLSPVEFKKLKETYGKTLLVFPAHSSVDRTKINFDQISLIDKINEIKERHAVKTVLINLFYSDCSKESVAFYEENGFKVCSAGYWLSENFLPNLRTILELSDLTMSNRVGTHVGYAVSLGKPHYIFKQRYHEDFIGKKGQEDLAQVNEHQELEQIDSDRIEFNFTSDEFIITKEQQDIVEEFWGSDIKYTPDQLQDLLFLK